MTLGGQTLTISNGSTTYTGIIQGTGGLTVTGGTQTLSGANTYTGATTISAGTLQIGSGGTTGSVTGDIVDNAALVFNRSNALTYAGVISGTGSLTKSGAGTLTLTADNTYAGGTTINAGTLAVSTDAKLGAASGGLSFGGGTLQSTATFTSNCGVTLNAGGGTFNTNATTTLTFGGTISGVGGLTKSGGGTLTLTATNTYQGNTTISGGTLAVSSDVNLGAATGILNLRGNGTLQFLANFTSNRNVTIGPGNANFDTNGHDATLGGAISVGSSSTELHKIGAGTLTLTGNNTYTGQLQINAGTLILTGDNQPSITFTPINSGATLQIGNGGGTGSLTGNVTDDGLFIINRSNAYTFNGVISGAGSFVQMGAGTTTLTATNSYSGGTTISAGTLAVSADANLGNTSGGLSFGGGTLQYLAGFTSNRGVTLNAGGGTFDTNGNDAMLGGTITSIGPLTKIGAGTLTLTGANTYSGGTTISGGTLQIGSGGNTGSIVGDIVNNAALTFNRSDDLTFSGAISGTGSLTKIGAGTLTLSGTNGYSGATTISSGTLQAGATNAFSSASAHTVASGAFLDLAGFNQTIGSLAGAGTVANTGAGATLITGGDNTSTTFSGVIQDGAGATGLTKVGTGTFTLSGANTYSGGTLLAAGTLRLENNQALGTGALTTTGSVVDYGNGVTIANPIVVNSNTTQLSVTAGTATQAGAISELNGPRPLEKIGAGTLVFTAANTYSGATAITAGTLMVNGSIANSAVTVNSGGTLAGTGTVGATTINGGGTFAPGPLGTPGAITVQGNLAFQSGALYLVQVNPSNASSANVIAGGGATLAGTVQAVFSSGSYASRTYTILAVAGGLAGTTFNVLTTTNLPAGFTPSLSYTATDVILNLTAALSPGGSSGSNQQNVAGTLNNFFNNGGTLPAGFVSVFGLTGGNLGNALSLLSGEAATGGQQVGFQMTTQFLGLMLDPFVDGRSGVAGAGGPALGFAPERETLEDIALAYASVLKAPPMKAPTFEQRWTAWGGAYGGSNRTSGDQAVVGSHDLSARTAGFAGGLDYHLSRDSVVGFALAGGGTNWSLAQGLGGGKSDAFQAGVYGATRSGPAYVAAAFSYTNHWMSTDRFAFAGDHLTASFMAQSFGARVESGYRFSTVYGGLTPYAAIQAQNFRIPSYSETDVNGGGFALAYNGRTGTDTRSELGARFDRLLAINPNAVLTLRARLAWAHDWVSDPTLAAVFQTLPGTSFIVNGATPAKDSALASGGTELRLANSVSLIGKFDGEFASPFLHLCRHRDGALRVVSSSVTAGVTRGPG